MGAGAGGRIAPILCLRFDMVSSCVPMGGTLVEFPCEGMAVPYKTQELFFVCGVYGVYFPLAGVAMWTSWQESAKASKVMRGVSLAMFAFATLQFSLTVLGGPYSSSAAVHTPVWAVRKVAAGVATNLLGMSTAAAGLLADGVLAWRCHVLYGSRRWMLLLLSLALAAVCGIGVWMAHSPASPEDSTVAWSPVYLAVNGVLTVLVTARIIFLHRQTTFSSSRSLLITVGRAVVESAFISWVAVFIGILCTDEPQIFPRPTSSAVLEAVQSALSSAMPTIFGISQALIITRVGLSRFTKSAGFAATLSSLTSDFAHGAV